MLIERYNYAPINRKTIDGKRHYATPDGNAVPSVTTILDKTKSKEKMQALNNWKTASWGGKSTADCYRSSRQRHSHAQVA
jgi:hypothetical protein